MTLTDTLSAAQDQAFDIIGQVQNAVVDVVKTVAARVEPIIPETTLPFAATLPTPSEIVDGYFSFAEKLLAAQRQFAEKLVAAAEPVLKGQADAAPAAKAEPKATAKPKAA